MELHFDENNEVETHDEPDGSDNHPCTTEEKSSSQTQRIKEGAGLALDAESSRSYNSLSQVMWHPSDLSVRPIIPSRKVDKLSKVFPSLPFKALQASNFVKMSNEQLDALSHRIIAILNGKTSVGEKQNVIRYLEMLNNNVDSVSIVTNGLIMLMLIKMLRLSKPPSLRLQLTSLIGLLRQHSTCIDANLANSRILCLLTDGLRDKKKQVRRFSMDALGELMCYISKENDHAINNNRSESISKRNGRTAPGWQWIVSFIFHVS
ncbi:hypothetical protein Q3G72_029726 [Acer saccharum]|nr:hypothetical protein Q3G72_029726 [Acer saccharum]